MNIFTLYITQDWIHVIDFSKMTGVRICYALPNRECGIYVKRNNSSNWTFNLRYNNSSTVINYDSNETAILEKAYQKYIIWNEIEKALLS